jgi:hypothetical protein
MASKSKTALVKIVTIVISAAIGYFVVNALLQTDSASFDATLMQAADEINKVCPIMVDQYTRLDNTIALPGKIFQYNYTLVTLTSADVQPDSLSSALRESIVNDVKTNPDMQAMRDNDVTVAYKYNDMNGIFLTKIVVKPEDYK